MSIKKLGKRRYLFRIQVPTTRIGSTGKRIYKAIQGIYPTETAAKHAEKAARQKHKASGIENALTSFEISEYRQAKDRVGGEDLRTVAEFWALRNPKNSITVAEALDLYLENKNPNVELTTRANLRSKVKWLKECLGPHLISHVEYSDLKGHLSDLPYKTETVNNHIRFLKAFFKWCTEEGQKWIPVSPAVNLKQTKLKRGSVGYFSVEELECFLDLLEERDPELVPSISLMLFAGIRPYVSIRMAKYANLLIDPDARSILVPQYFRNEQINKTKGYRLESDLLDTFWSWLGAYWDGNAFDVRNFVSRRKAIYALAGLKWVNDGLRHSFGTYAFGLTQNISTVASLLGHTTPETSAEHYTESTVRQHEARKFFDLRPKGTLASAKISRLKAKIGNWPSDEVLEGWFRKGMTNVEIAGRVGVSEAAVRKRRRKRP